MLEAPEKVLVPHVLKSYPKRFYIGLKISRPSAVDNDPTELTYKRIETEDPLY